MDFLPKLSMKNRAFIALVTIVIMILGAFSITGLRQELIPPVQLPAVAISAVNPGASAEQMAETVAEPLEKELRTLDNVVETSAVSNSNFTMIRVELEYGSDIFRAASQTDVIVNRISEDLPDGTTTQVITGGTEDIPAMVVSLSSDLPAAELKQKVEATAVPDLESVVGVATVQIFGGSEDIIRITTDAEAMAENELSDADIVDALEDAGLSIPGGSVTEGDEKLDITLGQNFDEVADLEKLLIATEEPPSVTLGDVATVKQVVAEATSASRTDGKESITMLVMPATNANFVDLSDQVSKIFTEAEDLIGSNTSFTPIFDQAPFIQESISGLATEGLWGLVIAVAVIFIFLLAFRPTIITGISIPLSVLFAFGGMLVTGTTINMMSLAGLMISIGRLVDDSIVVIENIIRHLRQAEQTGTDTRDSKARIIVRATSEVSSAVVSSTLVAILVFLPVIFVGGMAGELFRPFALTVVLALFGSTIVALTIVPVLAYWFMGRGRGKKATRGGTHREVEAVKTAATHDADDDALITAETHWMARIYRPVLAWSLNHRIISALLALGVFAGSLALTPLLKINLLGDSGMNMHLATQKVDEGSSLETMVKLTEEPTQKLLDIEDVETVQVDMGGQFAMSGTAPNEISYTIVTDAGANQGDVEAKISKTLDDFVKDNPDHGEFELAQGGSFMGSDTIDVTVQALDDKSLTQASESLTTELEKLNSVDKITSDFEAKAPGVRIVPRTDEIAARGMTANDVIGMVAASTADFPVTQVSINNTELDVHLGEGQTLDSVKDIENLDLSGTPLKDIAEVQRTTEIPTISTIDTVRTVTISATPVNNDDVGTATEAVEKAIDTTKVPDGTDVKMAGVAQEIDDTFAQLGLAMLAAILVIYIVLVWLLKSLMQPLILLMAVPFAATGMIIALLVTGTPLGVPSLVGLLMLIGIVVTNSIVLMDLVNQYRRRGVELQEAIIVGGQNRIRPILMTAAATIGAMIPPAIGLSGSSSFVSAPMSIAVIGGLIASTLITLIIVPVLYRMSEGWAVKRVAGQPMDL